MRYAIALLAALALCSPATAAKPVQRLLIVEASQQKSANEAAVKVFGPMAEGTFSVAMEDAAKKTYYVCSWRLTDEQAARLKAELDKLAGKKPQMLAKAKDEKNPKAGEFVDARAKLKEMGLQKSAGAK